MTSFHKGVAVGMLLGGGSGKLIRKDIIENGNYDPADEDPPVDGYDYVSVSVETYEDELAQALADLAAAQAQIADYQACQQAVISKIQEYDPNFDPQGCSDIVDKIEEEEEEKEEAEEVIDEIADDVGADKTDPTYPDNVLPAVKAAEGYTFPSDTAYTGITAIVGGDTLEDVDAGFSLRPTYMVYQETGLFELAIVKTASDGTETWIHVYDWSGGFGYTSASNFLLTVTNPSTGRCHFECDIEGRQSRFTYDFTNTKLIGFGASGHTFKAKNV